MIQYAVRRYFCKISFFNAMSRTVDQMLTEIFVIIFLLLSLAFLHQILYCYNFSGIHVIVI